MFLESIPYLLLEFRNAGEGAAPDALHRNFSHEALDEVEPRSAGRRKLARKDEGSANQALTSGVWRVP